MLGDDKQISPKIRSNPESKINKLTIILIKCRILMGKKGNVWLDIVHVIFLWQNNLYFIPISSIIIP